MGSTTLDYCALHCISESDDAGQQAFLEDTTGNQSSHSYHFYGGATRPPAEGERLLREILQSTTTCKGIDHLAAE